MSIICIVTEFESPNKYVECAHFNGSNQTKWPNIFTRFLFCFWLLVVFFTRYNCFSHKIHIYLKNICLWLTGYLRSINSRSNRFFTLLLPPGNMRVVRLVFHLNEMVAGFRDAIKIIFDQNSGKKSERSNEQTQQKTWLFYLAHNFFFYFSA